jgi:hypothetical protein
VSSEWILILTLVGNSAYAIEHVPGFVSRAQCEAAGQAWLNVVWASNEEAGGPAITACVFAGKERAPALKQP